MIDSYSPLQKATDEAFAEAQRAQLNWEPFHSVHEGWGVLAEETAELFDEIRKKELNKILLRKESIHVAAMALRIASELADLEEEDVELVDNLRAPFRHLEPRKKSHPEES